MIGVVRGHGLPIPRRQGEDRGDRAACRRLGEAPLFAGLDAPTLAALGSGSTVVPVSDGTSLVEQGVPSDTLAVLVEGSARVSVRSGSGRRKAVAVAHAVETFGESCLVDGGVPPVSAEMVGPGVVVVLDRTLLRASIDGSWLAAAVLRRLLAAVRDANRRLAAVAELDVQARVARTLLEATRRSPRTTTTLTEDDVADLASAPSGAAAQVLRNFDRLGWIDRCGEGICVTDSASLARLAGEEAGHRDPHARTDP